MTTMILAAVLEVWEAFRAFNQVPSVAWEEVWANLYLSKRLLLMGSKKQSRKEPKWTDRAIRQPK